MMDSVINDDMNSNKKLKLLFVSQVPNSRTMGVPKVLYQVGDELTTRGHQIDYLFEEDVPSAWFSKPLKKMVLLEWAVRAAAVIAKKAQQTHYDAIIITTASGFVLSSYRRFLLPDSTQIISWHHGFEGMMWEQMLLSEKSGQIKFSPQFKAYYGGGILWALRHSLAHQEGALFTSTEECQWVQSHYPKAKAAQSPCFLPNGVSDNFYYPERFDRPVNTPPKLLFVGYWDPWRKGKHDLITSYEQLHKQFPEIPLTLAGTGLSEAEVLKDFSAECQAMITVIPKASEEELIQLYQTHDIFVLPSLFEGLPLVLLEAMASGMACITTDCCGMKDVIEHQQNGLLIPRRNPEQLTEALSSLIQSETLRNRLGHNALQTVREKFTWARASHVLEDYLQTLCSKS